MSQTTVFDRNDNRRIVEEQTIYDHLLACVQAETPEQLVDRFWQLFIQGLGYDSQEVTVALNHLTAMKGAEEEFKFVLNRCCHILINQWRTHPQAQKAIPDLVHLFDRIPDTGAGAAHMRSVRRLRGLVRDFTHTEQYLTLSRLAKVFSHSENPDDRVPLKHLLHRYPYLYSHCMLSDQSSSEQRHTVGQVQTQMQEKFEHNLSSYVTYRIRQSQLRRISSAEKAKRLLKAQPNPTLLSDRELVGALKHYTGKVEGTYTHQDLAKSFVDYTSNIKTFKDYKNTLYEYLSTSVEPEYGKRKFNNQLYDRLSNTFSDSDSHKPTDFLVIRTCSQLLNFMVVQGQHNPQHYTFIDLLSNNGPTATISLLLKIVLVCRKVKPYLEKRLAILYNHYESSTRSKVSWLVHALEHMNIALSTNFGNVDLSMIR
ncbi:KilA-N domain-containing protein [Roseofilum casamattae]|uniref:KilA-N domain-containing protein n=1 Tax=Roseofilum casamattae BLCC-M143 TaxID=3022442 RepID=A0ABT7BZ83_9CYAN|nr:KilA-N domain-containing protein [Roseofilum casamattae]MDJ1183756.1 KilA-N domain-containing protein [Roseofilum casamattae BLCC-M143]